MSENKKNNEIIVIKDKGGRILAATDTDKEKLNQVKNGTMMKLTKVRDKRNLRFFRKMWALLRLSFDNWIPEWDFVSESEKWVAHRVAKRVAKYSGNDELYETVTKEIAEEVIKEMAIRRSQMYDPELAKSLDLFRAEILIKAGCFNMIHLPGGGMHKQPWSLAFNNMSEDVFQFVYPKVFKACWNTVLFQQFDNEEAAENMVNQLSGFLS